MWLRPALLTLFALSALVTVSAQGDDTVSITSSSQTIDTFADFTFLWQGEAGKHLNNITLELVEGSAEDNGNSVIDIMIANVSSVDTTQISYTLFPGIPAGTYHARLNGTIYNGNTVLSGTNTVSTLSNTFSIPDSGALCSAGTFTPVKSPSDPAYQPARITSPVGAQVVAQPSITGPDASLVIQVDAVDVLFDASLAPATMEVINTATGFNAGVQHTNLELDATILYATNNVTLDPGSWKVRMNFTIFGPASYPGTFSLESEEFFIVADSESTPNCTSSSSGSTSSASGTGPTPSGGTSAPSGSTPNQSNQPSVPSVSGAGPPQSSPPASKNAASLLHNPLQSLWICVSISLFISYIAREL
ncbi:hypothetical protein B0H11DRAFT_1992221 [Mycena galericulata]|nr:hypothetical protein B0H11DRAFT_1992221 [Mycena galericulata]